MQHPTKKEKIAIKGLIKYCAENGQTIHACAYPEFLRKTLKSMKLEHLDKTQDGQSPENLFVNALQLCIETPIMGMTRK